MYKVCKTRQSTQRQRYISDVLLQILRKTKMSDISICTFCKKAQIPRRTFYRYFDTLEDVLQYRFDMWADDYRRFRDEQGFSSDVPPVQKMEQFLLFWENQSDFLDAIYYNNCLSGLVIRMITSVLDESNRSWLTAHPDSAEDPQETVCFLVGGLMSVLIWDRSAKQRCSRAQLSRSLTHLIANTLHLPDTEMQEAAQPARP